MPSTNTLSTYPREMTKNKKKPINKSGGKPRGKPPNKPWGGRFAKRTDRLIEEFTESVSYDHRLAEQDILVSIAHAKGLRRAGVLSAPELNKIVKGLESLAKEIARGSFDWSLELEDVHMNIETKLIKKIGLVGRKLHTGRSRNDQIASDERLVFLRRTVDLRGEIRTLQGTIVKLATREIDTVMPAFTHLQIAQPVSFAHHALAWFEMLKRDRARLDDASVRMDVMPLGSAAGAGTNYPIDRKYVAKLLGFSAISDNSLDAVSDRDFLIELNAACALTMMHLSRIAEELILWVSQPFGCVTLPDTCCTGSSIMPQKKNPDAAELIRGKTGRVYGNLMALLTLMKAQPLAYNRDNQEDKEPIFDSVDTTVACVRVMNVMLSALKVNTERMRELAEQGYSTATEFADYLVSKGVAFRDAHTQTGKLVRYAITHEVALDQLSLTQLRAICPKADQDAKKVLALTAALNNKACHGGTAPAQVRARIRAAQTYLKRRA